MSINALQEIYEAKLQLIFDAEQQALQNAPSLLKAVQSEELRQALQLHAEQTRRQVEMLQPLVTENQLMSCTSMRALFEEAHHLVGQIQDPDARDAFVIAAAQAVEHHEIAAYGTARAWAAQLGRREDVRVLEETLDQEKQTDALLTRLAEGRVNEEAADGTLRGDREVSMNSARDTGVHGGTQGTSQGVTSTGHRTSPDQTFGS